MKIILIVFGLAFVLNLSAIIINIPDDYTTIQEGINVATSNDTVLIHPGIYYENLTLNNSSIIASLFLTTQDTSYISQTIIDANNNSNGFYSSEYYTTLKLVGFIIQNAAYSGVCVDGLNILVCENMIITSNNIGIRAVGTTLFVVNSIISNNSTNGISIGPSIDGYLDNVLICDNGDNGLRIAECSYDIYNTTFINNSTGIFAIMGGFDLVNSILWDSTDYDIHLYESTYMSSMYSNVQGGEAGIENPYGGTVNWLEGNINDDPLFMDYGVYPYSLSDDSPCVNTGIPDTSGLGLSEFDLAGNPRVYGNRIDMGAYENQNVIVKANDNSISSIPKIANFPNPFNPSTTIKFSIQNDSRIELSVFNIKGQKIRTLIQNELMKGNHSTIWNGNDDSENSVSSGIYLYKLNVNGKAETMNKCLLLK